MSQAVRSLPQGERVQVGEQQVREWVRDELRRAVDDRFERLESELQRLAEASAHHVSLVVFSGDLDKVLAGLVIATGAAAMGMEVSMFHTFWGLNALRKGRTEARVEKDAIERALGWMMPAGISSLKPSKLNFGGLGARLLRGRMEKNGVQSIEELFALARELGVRFVACQMSMEVMGIRREELVDGVDVGGVAAFLGDAAAAKVTLFI